MNATLYDPSDVAFGAQPRLVCAGCGQIEVGAYEPVCPECRKSLEQAEQLRSKNARPFAHLNNGQGAVAHSHLGKADLPTRMLPVATPVDTPAITERRAAEQVHRLLTHFEAARELKDLGVAMNEERVSQLRAWHPEGVPEDQLDTLQHRLTVRAGLRVVGGVAANE